MAIHQCWSTFCLCNTVSTWRLVIAVQQNLTIVARSKQVYIGWLEATVLSIYLTWGEEEKIAVRLPRSVARQTRTCTGAKQRLKRFPAQHAYICENFRFHVSGRPSSCKSVLVASHTSASHPHLSLQVCSQPQPARTRTRTHLQAYLTVCRVSLLS